MTAKNKDYTHKVFRSNSALIPKHKDKIKGIVITHGHLDHIGGIPFLIERLGNPPIYTRYLTSLMILKRQEECPHCGRGIRNCMMCDHYDGQSYNECGEPVAQRIVDKDQRRSL